MSDERQEYALATASGAVATPSALDFRYLAVDLISCDSGLAYIRWNGPLAASPTEWDRRLLPNQRGLFDAGSIARRRLVVIDSLGGAVTAKVTTDIEPITESATGTVNIAGTVNVAGTVTVAGTVATLDAALTTVTIPFSGNLAVSNSFVSTPFVFGKMYGLAGSWDVFKVTVAGGVQVFIQGLQSGKQLQVLYLATAGSATFNHSVNTAFTFAFPRPISSAVTFPADTSWQLVASDSNASIIAGVCYIGP